MNTEDLLFRSFELDCKKAHTKFLYESSPLEDISFDDAFSNYTLTIESGFSSFSKKFHEMINKRTDKMKHVNTEEKINMKYDLKASMKSSQKHIKDGTELINKIKDGKATDQQIKKFCDGAKIFVVKNGETLLASSIALADIITAEKKIKEIEKEFNQAIGSAVALDTYDQRSQAKKVIDKMRTTITNAMRIIKVESNQLK